MLQLASLAREKYISNARRRVNQWPTRSSNERFILRLVNHKNKAYVKDEKLLNFRRTKEGKMLEGIMIEYDQLFDGNENEKVLLEGDAGMGKSTFCTSFSEGWAKGNILSQFDLLLLLRLSKIKDKIISMTSLIKFLELLFPYKNRSMYEEAADDLTTSEGKKVLLLADGWDELQERARQEGFLFDLLFSDDILPSVSVLLTSRHSASSSLREHGSPKFDLFVEVAGFDEQTIERFIASEFRDEKNTSVHKLKPSEKASRLLEQVSKNPLVKNLCAIPLNCAIICHLWEHSEENFPSTVTGLYTKIVLSVIRYNVPKTHPGYGDTIKGITNICDLPKQLKKLWWKLCEFAFDSLLKDKIVFTYRETKQFFPKAKASVDEQSCFGLLQSFESISDEGVSSKMSFHFLHLSFQQYLAALHLLRQSPKFQLEVCQSHSQSNSFGMAWRFFFGLSCEQFVCENWDVFEPLKDEVITAFIDSVSKYGRIKTLLLCHCSFEASCDTSITEMVASKIAGKFVFGSESDRPHTALDCKAVFSVISNTQSCEIQINFSNCNSSEQSLSDLMDILSRKSGSLQLQELNLIGNRLSQNNLSNLLSTPACLESLQNLYLSQTSIEAPGVKSLEALICKNKLSKLSWLDLAEIQCDSATLCSLVDSLSTHCRELCYLDLSRNHLSMPGALGNALSNLLVQSNPNKSFVLVLDETSFGDKGVRTLIKKQGPKTLCLDSLSLRGVNLSSEGMLALGNSIREGVLSVKTLYLDENNLGPCGLDTILAILKYDKCMLEELSVAMCKLTTNLADSSICSVTTVQQHCALTHLYVDQNSFNSSEKIRKLFELMNNCRGLTSLSCNRCDIASEEISVLGDLLSENSVVLPNLLTWRLAHNNISKQAVDKLIENLDLFPVVSEINLDNNPKVSQQAKKKLKDEIDLKLNGKKLLTENLELESDLSAPTVMNNVPDYGTTTLQEYECHSDIDQNSNNRHDCSVCCGCFPHCRHWLPGRRNQIVPIASLMEIHSTQKASARVLQDYSSTETPPPKLDSDLKYITAPRNVNNEILETCSATKIWNLEKIHTKLGGDGITIAILDAAIDCRHSAFHTAVEKKRITVLPAKSGMDETPGNHGMMATFIAGGDGVEDAVIDRKVIGTIPSGVAPRATILSYPTGHANRWEAVIYALDELIKRGKDIHIVSMSFGTQYSDNDDHQDEVRDRIKTLRENDVIVVAAAGNYGNYKGGVLFPACLDEVISVGSLSVKGHPSNSNATDGIDVFAPGEGIAVPQIDPDDLKKFRIASGSSCATPAIAGLLALVLQNAKNTTPNDFANYCNHTYLKTLLFKHDMQRGKPNILYPYEYFTQNCGLEL